MSRSGRLAVAAVIVGIGVGLIIFLAAAFLRSTPPTVDFTVGHQAGQPVDMTLQTVGSIGFGDHPTWVSYLTMSPTTGQWVHTTLWDLPAHTRINVTIDQYDGGEPAAQPADRVSCRARRHDMMSTQDNVDLNSTHHQRSGNGVAHTFTIPTLGINVPLYGSTATTPNFCNVRAVHVQPGPQRREVLLRHAGIPVSTPGSASCHVASGSSSATEARCSRSATWTAS